MRCPRIIPCVRSSRFGRYVVTNAELPSPWSDVSGVVGGAPVQSPWQHRTAAKPHRVASL